MEGNAHLKGEGVRVCVERRGGGVLVGGVGWDGGGYFLGLSGARGWGGGFVK